MILKGKVVLLNSVWDFIKSRHLGDFLGAEGIFRDLSLLAKIFFDVVSEVLFFGIQTVEI